jgi:hypothetical protein
MPEGSGSGARVRLGPKATLGPMTEWLLVAVSLCGLLAGVFALMRANRVDAAMRRALSSLPVEMGDAAVPREQQVTLPDVQGPLSRIAIVRFDAFPDISGKLSSSAAILDDNGNGLVITTMNGRETTRSYIKQVHRGAGVAALSPEEADAVARAAGTKKRIS